MNEPWYMVSVFNRQRDQLSAKDLIKLRRFFTQQLALSQALLEAKQPGICKTTMSGKNPLANTSLDGILTNESSREILS